MAKILSIGAGVMGTAITVPAAINGHEITLIGTHLDTEIIQSIKDKNIHPVLDIELKNTKRLTPNSAACSAKRCVPATFTAR